MSEDGGSSSGFNDPVRPDAMRKVRVHKLRPKASASAAKPTDTLAMDRQIAELIPGIAELSVAGSMKTAGEVREREVSKEQAHAAEVQEMAEIFDFDIPNPVDVPPPNLASAWKQTFRPQPKRIMLSQYQTEMINYQRMLLRKNIWYYRDRMNNARGPCPVHMMKEAWVQGVIDENTLIWGQGLYDWLPAKNVKLFLPLVRTPEVRFGAWMKKTFSLKPALNRIRENRKDERDPSQLSKQVDLMR